MSNFLFKTDRSPAPMFIRFAFGLVMFLDAAQKVFGWFGGDGFMETLKAYETAGTASWLVIAMMAGELIGSVLLILGFFTRIWAVGMGVCITIALFAQQEPDHFLAQWFGYPEIGIATTIFALGMVLALTVQGGGLLSLDRGIAGPRKKGSIFKAR